MISLDGFINVKMFPDGRVGFILPVDGTDDQFVVGVERKFLVIQWDGKDGSTVKVVKELGEVDQAVPTTRINDGKADPKGRLFAGKCQIYKVTEIDFAMLIKN